MSGYPLLYVRKVRASPDASDEELVVSFNGRGDGKVEIKYCLSKPENGFTKIVYPGVIVHIPKKAAKWGWLK